MRIIRSEGDSVMSKRSFIIKLVIFVVLFAMVLPAFCTRINTEKKNNDVVIALDYNNAEMVLSNEELDVIVKDAKKSGVGSMLVAEETLNSLASSGYVTTIKYNVLCHKYDDESEAIIKQISNDDKIHNDSYIIITKREECKEYLKKWIPAKYSQKEYKKVETELGADVYVLYEGVGQAWQVAVGFDENKIKYISENGITPALSMSVKSYENTAYVDEIAKLCEKYDLKFINLKNDNKSIESDKNAQKNIDAFCKVIKEYGLFLVLSEKPDQLSNQNPIGYKKLIEAAEGRILRGYDAIDFNNTETQATVSEKYYTQIVNSVIDRNIRFVVVKQLVNGTDSLEEKSLKTNEVIERTIKKLNSMGYDTSGYQTVYDYEVNRKPVSMAALLMMILMGLMMLEWFAGKALVKMRITAIIGAVLAAAFTFVAPDGILNLYPTLFAVIAPCFAVTAVMVYVKTMKEKLGNIMFIASAIAVGLGVMLLNSVVQTALLSGLDYYLNILTFKGIKLSLMTPILFSAVAYGIIFSDNPRELISRKNIKKILVSEIKVYWLLIIGAALLVVITYIRRSGNVESISPIEALMRNTITEFMEARPRTKEFLVGWPAFVLFLYYMKNTKCIALQWILATVSGILFASVMNSFCHVFTGAGIIYMRVVNGVIIGAIVSAAALIINYIAILIVKKYILKEGH